MPIVMKSGSLKLLEPSGSVQASTGIAYFYLLTRVCELQINVMKTGFLSVKIILRSVSDTTVLHIVFVSSNAHAPNYVVICYLSDSTIFFFVPHYLINGRIFGKMLLNIKCVF
jgi:hypothetical protein